MDGMEKLKFLFIDAGGLSVDAARKVGQEGHTVYYYVPWQSAYSRFQDYAPGCGIPEITKVMDWAPHVDEVDCIVFPDVGMGELADWLRHKGYLVFGAGKGEEMEQDRILSTKVMEELGIKYPKTYNVNGIDEALQTLGTIIGQKTETNQNATGKAFVKFNVWRGSVDSFPAANLKEANYMFDEVRANIGPYSSSMPICIQETVEGIETGADLFFNGEEFIMPGMWGFEDGGNYIGYVTDDMGIFKNDLDRAAKYLRSVNYRGAFSFECIFDGKDCYWIDWTCRFPMPLGLMYCTFMENMGAFILGVATGNQKTVPLPVGEYLACMQLQSENALERYLPLKGGKDTKFMHYMMEKDESFAVPGISLLGICSAKGDSFAACQEGIVKEAKDLNIFFLIKDEGFLSKIKEKYIVPLSELGVGFGPELQGSESPKTLARASLESKAISDTDPWGMPS